MKNFALYYWPVPFRGQFIRGILAHCGCSWDEHDADAIEAPTPSPGCRDLLLRQTKRNPGLGRCCASGNEVLLGRYTLRKQSLLTREIAVCQGQPRTGSLCFGIERCSLAALDDRERLPPADRLSKVAGQRHDTAADCGRHDLRALWISIDSSG